MKMLINANKQGVMQYVVASHKHTIEKDHMQYSTTHQTRYEERNEMENVMVDNILMYLNNTIVVT